MSFKQDTRVSGRIQPSDYLRVLSRRRWLAGATFTLVFVCLGIVSLRKTPLYEAATQVLIEKESRASGVLNAGSRDGGPWPGADGFYQAQIGRLKSRALAWRTLETLGLSSAPATSEREPAAAAARLSEGGWLGRLAAWLGAPRAILPLAGDETIWQSSRIDAFLDALTVAPVRNSRLVRIRYVAPDPVVAARAVNALADAYVAQSVSLRAFASQEAQAILIAQVADQKHRLEASEQALQSHREKHGVPARTGPADSAVARTLSDMSAELMRARGDRLARDLSHQILKAVRSDPAKVATLPPVVSNVAIQALTREIADLKSQDAVLAADFGEKYQRRKDLSAQIALKDAELQSHLDRVIESARAEYEQAKARESALAADLDARIRQSVTTDQAVVGDMALDREVAGNRLLYENLLARVSSTGAAGGYAGAIVQVVDRAEMPRVPIFPDRGRDLLIAGLTGLLLAVGLAFGFEYLDSRIKSAEDIKNHLHVPFLGLIPAVRNRRITGPAPLLDRGVPPAFSEAVRGIRTSVMFSPVTEGARTVVVTSTAPGEGKTVVCTNLGQALAQVGLRTLVIDGDMRRPRVHDVFGCTQEPGLSNVLVGAADLQAAVRPAAHPLLSLLPAGLIPPNPAELLASPRYQRVLEALAQEYDWIVVDAPPVMAVTDAAVIANGVGGVLFVVGSAMTPRRNAQLALEQLVAARARVVGAVLNRAQLERHGSYYAEYYRKDYSHAYARSR